MLGSTLLTAGDSAFGGPVGAMRDPGVEPPGDQNAARHEMTMAATAGRIRSTAFTPLACWIRCTLPAAIPALLGLADATPAPRAAAEHCSRATLRLVVIIMSPSRPVRRAPLRAAAVPHGEYGTTDPGADYSVYSGDAALMMRKRWRMRTTSAPASSKAEASHQTYSVFGLCPTPTTSPRTV